MPHSDQAGSRQKRGPSQNGRRVGRLRFWDLVLSALVVVWALAGLRKESNPQERGESNPPASQSSGSPAFGVREVFGSALIVVLALALTLGALVGSYVLMWRYVTFRAEIALPLLLLAGVVLFIAALALLAAVFQGLGLINKEQALGLPEGSIRAILALMLVFLFFVAAIFLVALTGGGPDRKLTGITSDQFRQIAPADLVESTPHPTATPTAYDVTLRTPVSEGTRTMANNIVVLLGTLVTAVTAFYFGSKAVSGTPTAGAPKGNSGTG